MISDERLKEIELLGAGLRATEPQYIKEEDRAVIDLLSHIDAQSAQLKRALEALAQLLSAYGELHAIYGVGDCPASIEAREVLSRRIDFATRREAIAAAIGSLLPEQEVEAK